MKKILFTILIIGSCLYGFSQDTTRVIIGEHPAIEEAAILDVSEVKNEDLVYVVVEQNASFQGGDINTFKEWLMSQVKYPESARELGVEGKVILQFVVNTKGDVEQVRVLRSVDLTCDAEAVKAIKASPKWVPAKQSGKLVKQQFVIPVVFKLTPSVKVSSNTDSIKNEEPIFIAVDENAKFQGGDINTFRNWLMTHVKYPETARKMGIQGRVIAQFVVNTEGNVEKVKILRSLEPDCDAEVVRVIRNSPKWTPGKKDGKNVKQQFVSPVIFKFN